MEKRIQNAVELFMQGYNCSQSVVMAYADLYDLDKEMAKRIAAGFGGGVGRMRMMCGAVSALVILAGLDCGQTDSTDRDGKAKCYELTQRLLAEFKERNASIICADLLKMKGCIVENDKTMPDERNAAYYKQRPCAKKVESAARVFAEYLQRKTTLNQQ